MKDSLVNNQNLETLIANCKEGFPIKSLYVLELPIFNPENGFPFIKDVYGSLDRDVLLERAQQSECDILSLKFNIENADEIPQATKLLEKLIKKITKPLMVRGTNDDKLDRVLLPELVKILDRECIISCAVENSYAEIIPSTAGKHFVVLKSPIDINLAKEINILSNDLGQDLSKIIIDTDIGGLGYGFEYGYSIIEKIRLEGANDKFLTMPIISFAGEEALKTKEAKSQNLSSSWGKYEDRILMLEITATSAIRAAGANLIVVNHPQTLKAMKGLG
ncbi:hypothetical protein IKU74_07840 [bacterium]|nr:hypothetical protein [bacterium]